MEESRSGPCWNTPSRTVLEDLRAVQEYAERNIGYKPLTDGERQTLAAINDRLEQAFRDAEQKPNDWRLSEEQQKFKLAVGLMAAASIVIGLALGLLGLNF